MRLSTAPARVLEGDVGIGEDFALGPQWHQGIDMRIGINVVQPDPDTELSQGLTEVLHVRAPRAPTPFAASVGPVRSVGAGVLRDDQELAHPGPHQCFGLAQDVGDRTAHQAPAHRWNDAKAAPVVTALRNLEIGVVTRRQLDAARRQQVDERIVLGRKLGVDGPHHPGIVLRAGDRQQVREAAADQLLAGAADSRVTMTLPFSLRASPMASSGLLDR